MLLASRSILLGFLVLLTVASTVTADRIELRRSVRRPADGPVRLADVARLEGAEASRFADLVILPDGDSSNPGVRRVSIGEIRDLLNEAGAGWSRLELCGGEVLVRPVATARTREVRVPRPMFDGDAAVPSAEIADTDWISVAEAVHGSHGELARIAADLIRGAGGDRNLHLLHIRLDTQAMDRLPEGIADPRVRARGDVMVDRFDLNLTYRLPTGASRTAQVPVELRILREVPIAARDIPRNRPIAGEGNDLRIERRLVAFSTAIVSVDRLVGRRTRISVAEGTPVLASTMQPERLVAKGSEVTVESEIGGFRITYSLQALEPGCFGDLIRCTRTRGGDPVTVRVVGPNRVELPNQLP